MSETKLLPCPFCGMATKLLSAWEISESDSEAFAVCCNAQEGGCGATGGYDLRKDIAVNKWNRRTPAPVAEEQKPYAWAVESELLYAGKWEKDVLPAFTEAEVQNFRSMGKTQEREGRRRNIRVVELVERSKAAAPQVSAEVMTKLQALRLTHAECEDPWYSCPKHPEGCGNDNAGEDCTCGADKHNERIDEIIALLGGTP